MRPISSDGHHLREALNVTILWVALGGALGSVCRFSLGRLAIVTSAAPWPLASFSVNILGGFMIGVVYSLAIERGLLSDNLRYFIMVGFLGGFTTFSAYSLELVAMLEEGRITMAAVYAVLSTVLAVGACALGVNLAR